MAALTSYNQSVEDGVRTKDGETLRDLLRLDSPLCTAAMEIYVSKGGNLPIPMPAPWTTLPEIVQSRFATAAALNANNWIAACDHFSNVLSTYVALLTSDSAWSMPVLHALCADLRILSEEADNQLREDGEKPSRLERTERILKRGFTATFNDRKSVAEGSKKIGTLGVINQLLKVYFKLNNLRLCANLTRTVNTPSFPPFHLHPLSHRVTYKYYAGRLHLYEDRYVEAVEHLTYAVHNTPPSAEKNRRHILLYLIPAKILTGSLPTEAMLKRYNMIWFQGIAAAIKSGNLYLFNQAVDQHVEFFIRKALYLAVEKMRPLVYRSLCNKVATIMESNKIPLEHIRLALKLCKVEMHRDEIECILANLIFNNYIKGYVSHKVGYLVLSKKNPFPQLFNHPPTRP